MIWRFKYTQLKFARDHDSELVFAVVYLRTDLGIPRSRECKTTRDRTYTNISLTPCSIIPVGAMFWYSIVFYLRGAAAWKQPFVALSRTRSRFCLGPQRLFSPAQGSHRLQQQHVPNQHTHVRIFRIDIIHGKDDKIRSAWAICCFMEWHHFWSHKFWPRA